MKAICLMKEKGSDGKNLLKIRDVKAPHANEGEPEAVVALSYAALNHRDNWMTMGMYPKMAYGGVVGSDGCGVVTEVGQRGDEGWLGRRVILDPSMDWGPEEGAPGAGFNILGMPLNGTLAEKIKIPMSNIFEAPSHLTDAQAAALPLAGGTAYRALFTKGHASEGKVVLIPGIGGGVALIALQFAVATGCKVFVTSSSNEKIERAIKLGAVGGVNYKDANWAKELRTMVKPYKGIDCVIDGAGGPAFTAYLKLMKPGGKLVTFGATAGNSKPLVLPNLFLPNIDICGTAMASSHEFAAMVRLVNEHKIVPIVDSVHPFENIGDAIDKMRNGLLFGKLVIQIKPAAKL